DIDLSTLPQPESVYQTNRPAPKGRQKLAQNPEFNKWVEDVFLPATAPMDLYGITRATKSMTRAALNRAKASANKLKDAAAKRMALDNIRRAESELGQYNLQQAKKSATYPIDQWKQQPG